MCLSQSAPPMPAPPPPAQEMKTPDNLRKPRNSGGAASTLLSGAPTTGNALTAAAPTLLGG